MLQLYACILHLLSSIELPKKYRRTLFFLLKLPKKIIRTQKEITNKMVSFYRDKWPRGLNVQAPRNSSVGVRIPSLSSSLSWQRVNMSSFFTLAESGRGPVRGASHSSVCSERSVKIKSIQL